MTISFGYQQIFDHQKQNDCVIKICKLKKQGCSTDLSNNVNLYLSAEAPFKMEASEINEDGYSIDFCF